MPGDPAVEFAWDRYSAEVAAAAPAILDSGVVPGPPAGPFEIGAAYPLAVDVGVDGITGAVSFAALDPYPDIEPGWWCIAQRFTKGQGGWAEGGDDDNTTSPTPFARPAGSGGDDGLLSWCSNGALGGYGTPGAPIERWEHTFFGIAAAGVERLTVEDDAGVIRDLRITPWNGAFVAAVRGVSHRVTVYGPDGSVLGGFSARQDPDNLMG